VTTKVLKKDTHGTRTCYSYGGCRCGLCKDAELSYQRKKRATADLSTLKHGREYAYNAGCRCDSFSIFVSERIKAYRLQEPERFQAYMRKALYGLSEEQYQSLLAAQQGVCAICGSKETAKLKKTLSVDHCHKTGKVRGLLCMSCNRALGYLADDPARIRAAAEYLEKWSQ
jgi:hypothetical protein